DSGKSRHAKDPQPNADLRFEQFQHALDAGLPRGGEAVEIEPPNRHRVRPERNPFDYVGAAAEPAVHDDLGPAAHRGHHVLQDVDRCAPVVELAPAVVGDVDAVDTVVTGD